MISTYVCMYGMVWYGMVWYDMIWYDMIYYDIYVYYRIDRFLEHLEAGTSSKPPILLSWSFHMKAFRILKTFCRISFNRFGSSK